jgi:hypothetical protein
MRTLCWRLDDARSLEELEASAVQVAKCDVAGSAPANTEQDLSTE